MSAKELSALTGHGVDDCKAVLAECGGDVERAVDALLNSTY
jgi:translation elongation factor EF-Ts